MSYSRRTCLVCHADFTPPHRPTFLDTDGNSKTHCASCRRLVKVATEDEVATSELPILHSAAPLRQVVFDLETWGLDRGWGVTLVASFLIHGGEEGSIKKTLQLRDYGAWRSGVRSDDREMAEEIFNILRPCHVAYCHNGERFDIRWLRTVALKYGLDMPRLKLIDPCSISWKKYLIGRNSLEAVADFLGLKEKEGEEKIHISPDVWRAALMDNDDAAWAQLVERCESDVTVLNAIARRVTNDIGMIDYSGSWK